MNIKDTESSFFNQLLSSGLQAVGMYFHNKAFTYKQLLGIVRCFI